jgi:hypothetical protein
MSRSWPTGGEGGAVAPKTNKMLAITKASYPLTLCSKLFLNIEFSEDKLIVYNAVAGHRLWHILANTVTV